MSESPFISVIMPVYNRGGYIAAAIESALCQEDVDFELIISDDGSSDSTPSIIAAYAAADSRVRSLRSERNLGEGPASNAAFEKARGEWLVVLHSDDLLFYGALGQLAERLRRSSADIVITRPCRYDARKGVRAEHVAWLFPDELADAGAVEVAGMEDRILLLAHPTVVNKAFRMSHLRSAEIRFQDVRRVADLFFCFAALMQAETVEFAGMPLYLNSINREDTLTTQGDRDPLSFASVVEGLHALLVEKGLWNRWREGFIDSITGQVGYNLDTMRTARGFISLADRLRKVTFPELGYEEIEEGDCRNKAAFELCMRLCRHNADDRRWLRRLLRRNYLDPRIRLKRMAVRMLGPSAVREPYASAPFADQRGDACPPRTACVPTASVILVAKGGPEAFAKIVQSILSQTFARFELIIVGAAEGALGSICRNAAADDPRVILVNSEDEARAACRTDLVIHANGRRSADMLWLSRAVGAQLVEAGRRP